jgi:hypothetical protein
VTRCSIGLRAEFLLGEILRQLRERGREHQRQDCGLSLVGLQPAALDAMRDEVVGITSTISRFKLFELGEVAVVVREIEPVLLRAGKDHEVGERSGHTCCPSAVGESGRRGPRPLTKSRSRGRSFPDRFWSTIASTFFDIASQGNCLTK